MAKYFEGNPKGLPDHDAAIGCHVLLLQLFSVGIWRKLLSILDADGDGEVSTEELKALDIDGILILEFLKYGSEEKGSFFCKCSILLGFIMSKKLRGL